MSTLIITSETLSSSWEERQYPLFKWKNSSYVNVTWNIEYTIEAIDHLPWDKDCINIGNPSLHLALNWVDISKFRLPCWALVLEPEFPAIVLPPCTSSSATAQATAHSPQQLDTDCICHIARGPLWSRAVTKDPASSWYTINLYPTWVGDTLRPMRGGER